MKRLQELVESANKSDALCGCNVELENADIIFDHGWTHAIELVDRGLLLAEVKNTGWFVATAEEIENLRNSDDV